MKINKFESLAEGIQKSVFKDEDGESFNIYWDGRTCLFGGDETNQNVIGLFNPKFNIWSADELVMLGLALVELGKKERKWEEDNG